MSEQKPEREFVTIARIRKDLKFEGRLSVQFTDEGIELIKKGFKYGTIKRDSMLSLLKGEQKQVTIWTSVKK